MIFNQYIRVRSLFTLKTVCIKKTPHPHAEPLLTRVFSGFQLKLFSPFSSFISHLSELLSIAATFLSHSSILAEYSSTANCCSTALMSSSSPKNSVSTGLFRCSATLMRYATTLNIYLQHYRDPLQLQLITQQIYINNFKN